jgi:tRNA dimethylallyltransferase
VRPQDGAGTHVLPRSSSRDRERDEGPGARPEDPAHQASSSTARLTEGSGASLLVITGVTGAGKSQLAVEVALRVGGEIVGCDALQVYRGLDAATAKPSAEDRERVPHWLVDVADPRRDYSVADYVREADAAIADIVARGRVPVVAGGSGMYLRGLLKGLVEAPPRDPELRARLRALHDRYGARRLHRLLARLDAASAARLGPEDAQRIGRALELALSRGDTWSRSLERDGTWARPGERYRALKFALDLPRTVLAERLAARVDRFFAAGLVREVELLLAAGVPPAANAFKGIGYRDVLRALAAELDPQGTRDAVVVATRQYAKRQRIWFRKEAGLTWLDASSGIEPLSERITSAWNALPRPGGAMAPC